MDVKQHLLKRKRFFDEEIAHYKGPDPLKIRCEFFNWLENYSKEDISDIYLPLLEETLKLFMDHPAYKQDLRFIRLWLNYSATQPNPAEVMKNMHTRGLGTECSLLYSKWAEQLIKMGSFATADNVFKLGLTANLQTKTELQKQYDEFLKDIGLRVIMGKLQCPKCGTTFQSSSDSSIGANVNDNGACSSESVANWEWNPLKVGEKDDFECPLAYFEEDDPKKIRMYPKHKVYPGDGQEFSLEEIRAAEYELRYKEEEEREKARAAEERERALAEERERALAEVRAKEEEARKKEAETFKAPVQATIPSFTPKMLSLPKRPNKNDSPPAVLPKKFVGAGVISNWAQEMDSSLANSTTFTVHTKEAMNVVQDMWSSPTPAKINTRPILKSENPPDPTPAVPTKPQFEIYTEEDPAVPPPQKTPFQIYDENINSNQKKSLRSVAASRKPMEVHDDENAPPNQDIIMLQRQSALKPKTQIEIYNDNPAFKTPDEKMNPVVGFQNPKNRIQLFKDDEEDLADKLESQARIRPPMFNVQDKNDDFSDITCNTKAFEFILPSSTPLHKTQKPPNNFVRNEEPSKLKEQTNLSVILEQSKDRSGNSSTSSLAPSNKSSKSVAVLQTDENYSDKEESFIENVCPLQMRKLSSLYPITYLNTIIEEDPYLISDSSSSPNIVKSRVGHKFSKKTFSVEVNMSVLEESITSPKRSLRNSLRKAQDQDLKVDKENLCPGMLGFPFSNLIERPNSAIPQCRSKQCKPITSLHDQENMPCVNLDNLISEIDGQNKDRSLQIKILSDPNHTIKNQFHKRPLCSPVSGKRVSFKDEILVQNCEPNRKSLENQIFSTVTKHRRNSVVFQKHHTFFKFPLEDDNIELNEEESIGISEIKKDSLELEGSQEMMKGYLKMTEIAEINQNSSFSENLTNFNFQTMQNPSSSDSVYNSKGGNNEFPKIKKIATSICSKNVESVISLKEENFRTLVKTKRWNSFPEEHSDQNVNYNKSKSKTNRKRNHLSNGNIKLHEIDVINSQLETCNAELIESEGVGIKEINKDSLESEEDQVRIQSYLQMTKNTKMNKNAHQRSVKNLSGFNFQTTKNTDHNNSIYNNSLKCSKLSKNNNTVGNSKSSENVSSDFEVKCNKIFESKRWSSSSDVFDTIKTMDQRNKRINFSKFNSPTGIYCPLKDVKKEHLKHVVKYNKSNSKNEPKEEKNPDNKDIKMNKILRKSLVDKNTNENINLKTSLKFVRHTIDSNCFSKETSLYDSDKKKKVKLPKNKKNKCITIIPPKESDIKNPVKESDSAFNINTDENNFYKNLVTCNTEITSSTGHIGFMNIDSQGELKFDSEDCKNSSKNYFSDTELQQRNIKNDNHNLKNIKTIEYTSENDYYKKKQKSKSLNKIIVGSIPFHDEYFKENENFHQMCKSTDLNLEDSNIKAVNSGNNAGGGKKNMDCHHKPKSRNIKKSLDWKMFCSIPLNDKDFIEKRKERHSGFNENITHVNTDISYSNNIINISGSCVSKDIGVQCNSKSSQGNKKNILGNLSNKGDFTLPKSDSEHKTNKNVVVNKTVMADCYSENRKLRPTRKENTASIAYVPDNRDNILQEKKEDNSLETKKKDNSLNKLKNVIENGITDSIKSVKLEHTDSLNVIIDKPKSKKANSTFLTAKEIDANSDCWSTLNVSPNGHNVNHSDGVIFVSNEFDHKELKKKPTKLRKRKNTHSGINSSIETNGKITGIDAEVQDTERNKENNTLNFTKECKAYNSRLIKNETDVFTDMPSCFLKKSDNWNNILKNIDRNTLHCQVRPKMSEPEDNILLKEHPNTRLLDPKIENPDKPQKRRGRPPKVKKPTKVNNENKSTKKIIEDNFINQDLAFNISLTSGKCDKNDSTEISKKKLRSKQKNIETDDKKSSKTSVRRSTRIFNQKTVNFNVFMNSPVTEDINVGSNKSRKRSKAHPDSHTLVPDTFDPFNSEVIEDLLKKIGFPKAQYASNYNVKSANLPTGTKTMKLGTESYSIIGEIGKGAYAKVIKASNSLGNVMALKIEKPACKWEFYIAKEIQLRIPPKMAPAFMDISSAYIYNNGSILETQFAKYGTLITNINTFKEKLGKPLDLGVILHFSLELIDIVEYLHKCKIIHADLKPDNVVLRELPSNDEIEPCLQLIDFGRCIDMSLLPSDTKFNTVFKVEDNKCIEMKENKSWTYQIDLQGLASIFHVLLFSEYMKIQKKNNIWQLQKTIPRNLRRELWNPIFESLLNVNPARDLPFNFNPMRQSIMEVFNSPLSTCLNQQLKVFGNHISGK